MTVRRVPIATAFCDHPARRLDHTVKSLVWQD